MKSQGISEKIECFLNGYQYINNANENLHFLVKCIFLKYLVDHQQIDFEINEKKLKLNFTLDNILSIWQGRLIEDYESCNGSNEALVIGDYIWEWMTTFIDESPSLAGEKPMIIGKLYEECIHLSHKKSQGIFYTPEKIASFMAGKLVLENEQNKFPWDYRILDPACGSGALLSAVYDEMYQRYEKENNDLQKNVIHQHLLEKSILGIDRDSMACLVTQLILILKGSDYVKPLGIQCGDILVDDLIAKESIDGIIGNPPYVGHKEINKDYMKELKIRYPKVYQDKGDLSYCFINRGWELLKENGELIHISSRYYLEAYYGKLLRRFLKEKFEIMQIIDFNGIRIIPGVGVDPGIIKIQKKERINEHHKIKVRRYLIQNHKAINDLKVINGLNKQDNNEKDWDEYIVEQATLSDDLWRLYSPMTKEIINKIEDKAVFSLDNVVQSFQGIITGNDKAFIFNNDNLVLEGFKEEQLKPWIKNKDIGVYSIEEAQKKILYTNAIENIENDDCVMNHLTAHKEKLKKRRECKNGKLPWYAIQWGRDTDLFNGRKIIFPYKATKNRFAIDENKCFFSADIYGLIIKERLYHHISEEFLVVLLNSKLYNFYFKSYGKKLGDKLYEYYPNTLLKLKVPNIDEEKNNLFKEYYDKIINLKKNQRIEELINLLSEIDLWIYEFFGLNESEIGVIENNK